MPFSNHITYYALIQKGEMVLDVGTSKEQALEYTQDCNSERDLDVEEYYLRADDGDYVLVECTEEFYLKAMRDGDIIYEIIDNIAHLEE
tara:strand:+ start:406 stop:672 length:267 start_codon:yes stop_codon:yes gene_type:complete